MTRNPIWRQRAGAMGGGTEAEMSNTGVYTGLSQEEAIDIRQ